MVKFTLTGPLEGHTGAYGGFLFKDGVTEVHENDAENAERMLCRFFGAVRNGKPLEEVPIIESETPSVEGPLPEIPLVEETPPGTEPEIPLVEEPPPVNPPHKKK